MNNKFLFEQRVIQYFYEKMNAGIIVIDTQGNVQYINQMCTSLLNVKPEEALGRHYNEVFAHVPEEERYTLITLETGKEFNNIQHIHFLDGRYLVTDTYLLKNENEIIGALAIFKDVSDIKNIEKKLENAMLEKEKLSIISHMAAGMAHEIKNPLTAVRGFAQLLSQKYADNKTLAGYLKIIMDEVDQATRVITDFLQLARPKQPVPESTSIGNLIKEIAAIIEPQSNQHNVIVKYDLPPNFPNCFLDRNQVKQVLLNICKNSIEAMPGGGDLNIRTGLLSSKKEIFIEIADTGCGIPCKNLPCMGVPFFTTKADGTGLGLSISYAIINAHGGRIEVTSKEGQGTKFRIYLPLLKQMTI